MIDSREPLTVVDDRAGFYMVPAPAIAKARARLSGAHLTEALAGLVCLAREAFVQYGASREEQQTLEANLDDLAGRILGVSRARALRTLDNLVDAAALTKNAHRFDGTRRLPTKITFVDLAYSFAYVSGPAFRALRTGGAHGSAPFGALALYLTLVALGGEQRDQFPDGNRRIARASQPELAKLSGLSVSSVQRAAGALTAAGLLAAREQAQGTLKTKTIYRLTDPPDDIGPVATSVGADRSQPHRPSGHSRTNVRSQPNRPLGHSPTDVRSQPNRPSIHGATNVGPQENRSTVQGATDGQLSDPARAHVNLGQRTAEDHNQQIPLLAHASAAPSDADGGEVQSDEVDQLIEAFCAWTRGALGERRADALYDPDRWRRAAQQLLEQYDLQRILAGVERLGRDALLADQATTLPAFARIADRAIARAAADRGQARHRELAAAPMTASSPAHPSWATAHELLRQAVGAYGGSGEERALAHLEQRDAGLARFARHVGWRTLARSEEQMTDVKFAYLEFCRNDRTEDAA
jgi:hypothetical protein